MDDIPGKSRRVTNAFIRRIAGSSPLRAKRRERAIAQVVKLLAA
jgi:hypothetical protein